MKVKRLSIYIRYFSCLAALAMTGCIDEDLSDCGAEMSVQYNVQLKLNLKSELYSELTTAEEQQMAARLEESLSHVFTTQASGLDLSFFDAATSGILRHETHDINSNQASFTLYMAPNDYRHTALAHTAGWGQLHITSPDSHTAMKVEQEKGEIIEGHSTGLFCGREEISVESGQSRNFNVELHMQNAASVLVLHHSPAVSPTEIKTYICDMGVSFCPADSTFDMNNPPTIRTQNIEADKLTACYAVSFPSADEPAGHAMRSDDAAGNASIWRMVVLVTMPDGKTTKNTLYIRQPLKAGTLKVLKGHLDNHGELITDEKDVGVSVQLDWESGGDHDIDM